MERIGAIASFGGDTGERTAKSISNCETSFRTTTHRFAAPLHGAELFILSFCPSVAAPTG